MPATIQLLPNKSNNNMNNRDINTAATLIDKLRKIEEKLRKNLRLTRRLSILPILCFVPV